MTLLSAIITEVRANLNEGSTVSEQYYANEELINYSRRSIDDLCIDTDSNYRVFGLEIVGSSVGTITAASGGTDTVFTLATHGLSTNDVVYISGMTGTMASDINDYYLVISALTVNTFSVDVNTSGLAYTAGGAVVLMPYQYTFASICTGSATALLDVREIIYHSSDNDQWLYDDLVRTNLKTVTDVNYLNNRNIKQSCIIENNAITLTMYPYIGDIIYVTGRWSPLTVTTSGDTYPLGAVEEDATIKYVTSMGWLKKNKPEVAIAWMNLYQERKKAIQIKKARLTQATYPSGLTVSKSKDSLIYRGVRQITT